MTFVLTEKTAVVRTMELHDAAKKMGQSLGLKGEVSASAGDFMKQGWQTGWLGKPGKHDVYLEVFATPTRDGIAVMDAMLALAQEVDRLSGPGAHNAVLRAAIEARDERAAKLSGDHLKDKSE